ncbi:MAG TPA: IS630 transposase-related protein [Stellaceae bacterium]|nr:IS630 transposase-related protein [Stellaceae bacterium]
MPAAYSDDLRERVIRSVEAGASRRSTAQKFEVSVSFVIKLMQRWRGTGTLAAKPRGGTKTYRLSAHAAIVQAMVAAQPDITLDELRARLEGQGVAVGRSSVGRFLNALALTRKKRRSTRPSRTVPTSPPRGRRGAITSRA